MVEWHEKIERLIGKSGIPRAKLAEWTKVRYETISRWSRGDNMPSIREAKRFAAIFGITLDVIFYPDRDLPESLTIHVPDGDVGSAQVEGVLDDAEALHAEKKARQSRKIPRQN